jgi:hypothetical protein
MRSPPGRHRALIPTAVCPDQRRADEDEGKAYAGVLPVTSSLLGPPVAGKSMLARRLTTFLPAMTPSEAIEGTGVHSVAGRPGDCPTFMSGYPASM